MTDNVGALRRASLSSTPFVLFAKDTVQANDGSTILLTAGSIRIAASSFVNDLASDLFLPLDITSGQLTTIRFGFQDAGQYFEVGTNVVVATLQLSQGPNPADGFGYQAPATVVFEFTTSSSQLRSANDITLVAFGNLITMQFSTDQPWFEDGQSLAFPFHTDIATLNISRQQGTLGMGSVNGLVDITRAAWIFNLLPEDVATEFEDSGVAAGSPVISVTQGLIFKTSVFGMDNTISSRCGPCVILVDNKEAAVRGKVALGKSKVFLFDQSTIAIGDGHSMLDFILGQGFDQQGLRLDGDLTTLLSQPLDVNGELLVCTLSGKLLVGKSFSTPGTININVDANNLSETSVSESSLLTTYSLRNLLVQGTTPGHLSLNGSISSVSAGEVPSITAGTASIQLPVVRSMPILPDPYATNLVDFASLPDEGTDSLGDLAITLTWSSGTLPDCSISLPNLLLAAHATRGAQATNRGDDDVVSNSLLSLEKQVFRAGTNAPCLLDLSTNASQLGLEILRGGDTSTVADLTLQLPMSTLTAAMLPPIAWEPVLNAASNNDSFPPRFQFPNDGPPVRIVSQSVELVPVLPGNVIESISTALMKPDSADVAARFTLPFGMIAYATLQRPPSLLPGVIFQQPSLTLNDPSFVVAGYASMRQVTLLGSSGKLLEFPPKPSHTSASIPGSAVTLKFDVDGTGPTSIIGAGGSDLNQDFGPSFLNRARHGPLIPATRVDISGFGASMNSHWFNNAEPPPTTQRVDLNTYMGRSERAVIEQNYEIVHCGARAVRTVTMQRANSGLIYRQDVLSAGSDGVYAFVNPAILTHSGLVTGYFNLRNLRDGTGENVTTQGNFKFAHILYDADVELSTSVGTFRFPVLDHKGFISLTKSDATGTNGFTIDSYVELIDKYGTEIGGPINTTVIQNNIALKIGSISVGYSFNPTTQGVEFVVTANATASFAGHGEWSWLRYKQHETATVIGIGGIPVIREGLAGRPTEPAALRFANSRDLLEPFTGEEYAILHTGPNQRMLFPRPKVEPDGHNQFTSDLVPLIADPFALSTAVGPFPTFDFCIPFETIAASSTPSYSLVINPDTSLRLVFSNGPFPATTTQRKVFDNPDLSTIVYTEGTEITLQIDSSASPPWHFEMSNLALATETSDSGTKQELQRVVGTLICTPNATAQFKDAQLIFGPPLQPVQDMMAFMKVMGPLPPLQLSMTNDWSSSYWLEFELRDLLNRLGGTTTPNTLEEFVKNFVPEASVRTENSTKSTALLQKMEARIVVDIPHIIFGADLLLTGIFNMTQAVAVTGVTESGNTFKQKPTDPNAQTLEIGAGAGLGWHKSAAPLGIFSIYGLLTLSVLKNLGTGSFGFAAGILIKGELSIAGGWFSITISAELKGIMLIVKCIRPEGDAHGQEQKRTWGIFQATFALELHICFVFDIAVDWQYQDEWPMTDGQCRLEEFGQIP